MSHSSRGTSVVLLVGVLMVACGGSDETLLLDDDPSAVCGDGTCALEAGEHCDVCPEDCGTCTSTGCLDVISCIIGTCISSGVDGVIRRQKIDCTCVTSRNAGLNDNIIGRDNLN